MRLGEWRRGRVIGRGATATVSLASSVSSGKVFAVKSAELSRSGSLQWEQRILSTLESPFIVSYFGFDVSPPAPGSGLHYHLFMEYAGGGSLSNKVNERGVLDESAIRAYARDILNGLVHLHSSGVVHCDLKPQNVLVCSSGRAKIADFGCALLLADEEDGLGCVQPRGTPMFMAPEVARGEEQGAPADVWALGCTVIEIATARPPWPHVSDPVAALHRIAFSVDLPEIPNWISSEGKDFLSRCLRRDHRERWTAEQLLKHPFVATSKSDMNDHWISPTSTLDQAFWESITDDDSEVLEQETEDPLERMQHLFGSGGPSWTWDDKWSVVRSDNRKCGFSAINSSIVDDKHNSAKGEALASDSGASCSEDEFAVGADDMDTENVFDSSCSHSYLSRQCISVNDTGIDEVRIQDQMRRCKRKLLIQMSTRNALKFQVRTLCMTFICVRIILPPLTHLRIENSRAGYLQGYNKIHVRCERIKLLSRFVILNF